MGTKKDTAQAAPAPADAAQVPAAPVFKDKAYTSRTLILPSGAGVAVKAGQIAATSDELLAYLGSHAEFERLPE